MGEQEKLEILQTHFSAWEHLSEEGKRGLVTKQLLYHLQKRRNGSPRGARV